MSEDHGQITCVTTVQERWERLDHSTFFGIPIAGFENAGRQQLTLLIMSGLEPQSKVLDIGCGVLRAGYWLIHFLDPHCYFGIEPHRERLETGRTMILEPESERVKQPSYDTNASFDSSVFGVKFDFFLAYSIWTHAPKPQIEVMLDNFLRDSNPGAVFLTTILPAVWPLHDYAGENWFGTSHESNVPGCIRHRISWIKDACRRRGLHVRKIGRERDGQTWLLIARDERRRLLFRTIWAESFMQGFINRIARARSILRQ
ncbi:MAG TPA: class I SAM-dependent methyltransferase [Thermoanaerobaculia bacterium]|nr:class I SAM-dependent methyltransferase [Thermoanaerobaculia bacterium]